MGDIIVYIPKDMEEKLREKTAEMLRIHQIQTTNDISKASVIVHIPDTKPKMTIEEIALMLIEQTNAEIFKLKEQFDISNIPVVLPSPDILKDKCKTFNSKHRIKQYKQTKQRQKRIFFNRTKCK